jgi:predicted ATPase
MDFNIEFYPEITFLTGINGSGKTTVVQSISSLLSASFVSLANIQYELMAVRIEKNGEVIQIITKRDDGSISLESSQCDEPLRIQLFPDEENEGYSQMRGRKFDYYLEQETANVNHPVIQAIRKLTPPMFLGLERRSYTFTKTDRNSEYLTAIRRSRNVFGGSLYESLRQAVRLAEINVRNVQVKQKELADQLRRDIILNALDYEDVTTKLPSLDTGQILEDPNRIEARKRLVKITLKKLGLSEEEISVRLDNYFGKLKELYQKIPKDFDFQNIVSSKYDPETINIAVQWIVNSPQFERIRKIILRVEEFVNSNRKEYEPIEMYLASVNQFLNDSKKEIQFDDAGNLIVSYVGQTLNSIASLSSGECQIVVIITHLAFNPVAKMANVFIVDEPELSLHVRWQELFVNTIRMANPNLQLILATHSPSIILDREEFCIDLSRGRE